MFSLENLFFTTSKKIPNQDIRKKVKDAVLSVETAATLQDIPCLKKLKGQKRGIYYRIKTDDYRIGIKIENETVTFVICDKRKDIYKYSP